MTFSRTRAACCFSPRLVEVRWRVRPLLDDLGHDAAHGVGAEDLLGLPLELRLGEPDRDDGGEAGEDVVLLDLVRADLEPAGVGLELLLEDLEQRLVEAGEVGAALGRGDDVDEGDDLGLVAGPPPQRDVDAALALDLGRRHVALVVEDGHRLGERAAALEAPDVGDRGVGGEELAELRDPAVVDEHLLVGAVLAGGAGEAALVPDDEGEPGHEEARLPGPGEQPVDVELGALDEDLVVGPVADPGPGGPPAGPADDGELAATLEGRERVGGVLGPLGAGDVGELAGLAAPEAHRPDLAAPVDLDVEARGERVDDRGADAVEAARGGVGAAAELAAGVQLREDDLDAGEPGARLDVDGDAAPVVPDLDRAVGEEDDLDPVAHAGEGLVDGVVDDLPEAVHEPAGVGGADVHAGPLADRLEPLEHLEVVRGVLGRGLARRRLLRRGARGGIHRGSALQSVGGHGSTGRSRPPVGGRHSRKANRRPRRRPTGAPRGRAPPPSGPAPGLGRVADVTDGPRCVAA